jgi:hypothetical protein
MRILFNMLGVLLFLLPVSPEILGETGKLELDFSGKTCSVRIEKAPLRTVLTKIKREKGIWYKVSQSSAEETISISFSELSIREGIERILRNFNFSLHFDQDDWLLGVTVVGKKERADYWSKEANSNSKSKRRKGIHPKTLSGLEYSSKELPYDSPAVKIIED